MLAGDGAAQADRQIHDVAERLLRPRRHGRVARVVNDQRVGVAVTGVRHHCDGEVGLCGDLGHPADEFGQFRQRHPDVLKHQRALVFDGDDGIPACGDECLALCRIVGAEALRGTGFGEHSGHELGVLYTRRSAVVGGGDHQRRGAAVQPHPQLVLDGVDRRGVHELQHRRPDLPGDGDHRRRGSLHRVEGGHHGGADVLGRQ